MKRIDQIGITVSWDTVDEGYYVVTSWRRDEQNHVSGTNCYRKLTWGEAMDVVGVICEENRPGKGHGADIEQHSLW